MKNLKKMTSNTKLAAIYSPYLDTLGGGERYIMTIAEVLSKNGFRVDVLLDEHLLNIRDDLKLKLAERFNLNLDNVSFIKGPIGKGSNLYQRLFFLKQYDLLFYLTDGSIFYPSAKKNFLHIQSPLVGQPTKSVLGRLKLKGWNLIIYNSQFTQENAQKNWPIKSQVIYPPVDVEKIKPLKKKKYILSVGRFFGYLKDKKYELMIKTFKQISKELEGWSLHLAGSASEGDEPYLEELKNLAKGLEINFYPNLSYKELVKLYGESSIYWHAAGFGEEDPTKMEHFGITTVEAMAGGAVPVVIGKGGQLEIVTKDTGFIWNSPSQLGQYTIKLSKDEALMKKMSPRAVKRAQNFSKAKFEQKIGEIIK